MNASLPPEDERREDQQHEVRQEVPLPAPPIFGWGTILGLLFVVAVGVILLLPAIQGPRWGATRSTQAEMNARQQAIEQAAREASNEDGIADNR